MKLSWVLNNEHEITVFINNKLEIITSEHMNFEIIKDILQNKSDHSEVIELISTISSIDNKIKENENTKIKIDRKKYKIVYNDLNIKGALFDKLVSIIDQGLNIQSFEKFLMKLDKNPKKEVFKEVYTYLENNNMPITQDGNFLAYKKITSDYKDCYTKTIDNSLGKVVQMKRENCNSHPHHTCTEGLHVCGYNYLSSFYGDKIIICEINPADIVAIPEDYNYSKMRVCKYKVIDEIINPDDQSLFKKLDSDIFKNIDVIDTSNENIENTVSKKILEDSSSNIIDTIKSIFQSDSNVIKRILSHARKEKLIDKKEKCSTEKLFKLLKDKLNKKSTLELIHKIKKTRPNNIKAKEFIYSKFLKEENVDNIKKEENKINIESFLQIFINDSVSKKAVVSLVKNNFDSKISKDIISLDKYSKLMEELENKLDTKEKEIIICRIKKIRPKNKNAGIYFASIKC